MTDNITMKTFLRLMLLICVLSALPACHDSDVEPIPGNEEHEIYFPIDSLYYEKLISDLVYTDVTETGDSVRKIAFGRVLNPAEPTVYSMQADSLAEARERFITLSRVIEEQIQPRTTGTLDLSIFKAHLRFEEDLSDGKYGVAYIDIPDLPELTKIEFVPKNAFPVMNSKCTFQLNQIWECPGPEKDRLNYKLYLVVKDSSSGPGQLLGVSEYTTGQQDWFQTYTYFQGKFMLWKDCANNKIWQSLDYILRQPAGKQAIIESLNYFEDMYNASIEHKVSRRWNEMRELLYCVTRSKPTDYIYYQIGSSKYCHVYAWSPPYNYYGVTEWCYDCGYQPGDSKCFGKWVNNTGSKKNDRTMVPPLWRCNTGMFFDWDFDNSEWKCIVQ